MNRRRLSQEWFTALQTRLCAALETLEASPSAPCKRLPKQKFQHTPWRRRGGGGGHMALLQEGRVIEKAGVHISTVYGELAPALREHVAGAKTDPRFWATGLSVIVHPRNPHAPAAHMNTRHIITTQEWFAGGADLTPMLPAYRKASHEDTRAFHAALKQVCTTHPPGDYPRFKKWCDDYFTLPHRNETRGVGGIFYDHLNTGNPEQDFAFTQAVGEAFLNTYPQILARRLATPWTPQERTTQLIQRGRYVEFNLLYDRGTQFGLKTGGNIHAILSSLPPKVLWP